jgi:tetratricopeptide (TPR) repeat protein
MNDAMLWNEFGNIYLKMDLFDEAIAVYLRSIELNPDSGWTYSNLAYSYYKKGEFGRAISLYRISIPLLDNPKYMAITWNRLGDAFRALKDVDNAVTAYKKADEFEIGPSISSALGNKPQPVTKVPQPQAPSSLKIPFGSSKGIFPGNRQAPIDNPNNNRVTGGTQPQSTNRQQTSGMNALSSIRRMEQKPNSPELISLPPRSLEPKPANTSVKIPVHTGEKAAMDVNDEIRRSSLFVIPSPMPDQSVGEDQNSSSRKVTSETRPVELNREEVLPTRLVQDLQGKEENISEPKAVNTVNLEETLAKVNIYENITRANPNNDRAWDTLGKLYKQMGRFEDSIQAYKQAIDKAPGREVYYYYLGLLYSVIKQDEEAAWAFENVLKLNPDYVLAHSALAGIYHRMGFDSKANEHINIALPKMKNESGYNLACFYAICGEVDKALEYLQQALLNKDTTIEWIRSDPDLELLHNDPRYLKLIQEVEKSQNSESSNDNYFSSELDGPNNKLLPLLNNSLTR